MEQIISNLLVSDNAVKQKGQADLAETLKDPKSIPALVEIVATSPNPQHRHISAVLLKKQLGKLQSWHAFSVEDRNFIKSSILNALVKETEKSVRNAIVLFVVILIKHEDNSGGEAWVNEILKFIFEFCRSPDPNQSEISSSVFAVLTNTAPDQFIPHIESICQMFLTLLMNAEQANPSVVFNILMGMSHLVLFTLGHNGAKHTYQKAIPIIISTLEVFAFQDAEKFVKVFEILENLADFTQKLLKNSTQMLIEFCLRISSNVQIDSSARVKSMAYIGCLVSFKKKQIIKLKLIEPILQVIFSVMASEHENDDEDYVLNYFLENYSSQLIHTAIKTLNLMALHVPPEKLIPPLLQLLEPALRGTEPFPKKGAYLCMAVVAKGCSEAICSKHLPTFLEIVKVGIVDGNVAVRNAAFFALAQFAKHLQPDITKFAPEILPILFQYLQNDDKEIDLENTDDEEDIDLENSDCEDNDEDIAGYSVENSYLNEKVGAILCLEKFALQTGPAFIPYLQTAFQSVYKVIDHIKEDIRKVSIIAIVTFTIYLYKQKDEEGAKNAINIILPKSSQIINDDEDEVVLRALYGISVLLKELTNTAIPNELGRVLTPDQFAVYFEKICPIIIQKIKKSCKNEYNGDIMRSFAYRFLAECFDLLQHHTQKYYDVLIPIMIAGINDESEQVRQHAISGTFDMVFYAKEKVTPDQFAVYFEKICPIIIQKIKKSFKNEDNGDRQRSFANSVLAECFDLLQHHTQKYYDVIIPIMIAGINDESEQVKQHAITGTGKILFNAEEKLIDTFLQVSEALALSNALADREKQEFIDLIDCLEKEKVDNALSQR